MKWLITGATGFVGQRLIEKLLENSHSEISILTRSPEKAKTNIRLPIEAYSWNPRTGDIDEKAFEGVDIVVHLAGENVAEGRWSEARKKAILESREQSTQLLTSTLSQLANPPKRLVSASAVGIYGDRGDEQIDEKSNHADDFLAKVCKRWEEIPLKASLPKTEVKIARIGVVLGPGGGALAKMLPPFYMGGGGRLGDGRQYMSWIHRDDLCDLLIFLGTKQTERQIFNAVAPRPVTNQSFTKVLGKVLSRPTIFPVPAMALKVLFGEMSTILLGGQRVLPTNALVEGFDFKFAHLHDALDEILAPLTRGEFRMRKYQTFKKGLPEIFSFFSNEKNLEKLTPDYLHFKVEKKSTEKIEAGTLIDYRLKLHGLPLSWRSEISEYEENSHFTDIQLKGPYQKWEHTHSFLSADENTTIMTDNITYKMPMGILGRIVALVFVKRDLEKIFEFRRTIMDKNFN